MHTDTETQQFGDQAHTALTAVCINVSLFISYHCILTTLWLTYLPRARGQQGSLAYLVFT